jgi:predicted nuclease of predicted toxin-antitoxin system
LPKVIVDENIPREVTQWLAKKGFQLTRISQKQLKGAKDYAIAEFAEKHNLTIITLDNHFSHIYRMHRKKPISVIIIKAKPAVPANIVETLEAAHEKMDLKSVKGKLIIISKRKIRIIT